MISDYDIMFTSQLKRLFSKHMIHFKPKLKENGTFQKMTSMFC